jgi:hypothetical protein
LELRFVASDSGQVLTLRKSNLGNRNHPIVMSITSVEFGKEVDAAAAPTEEEKKDDGSSESEGKPKSRTVDWPLTNIQDPHENDVMYGRGGGTNHHKGNKRYRQMVEDRKVDYVNSKRLDKPMVALEIVREWRAQDPPGRFLKLDEKTNQWNDVGDRKAREKISQALREKAPLIRKQQEEERLGKDGTPLLSDDSSGDEKRTRFAQGTNTGKRNVTKAVLARDHSLGREYLEDNEAVTLDGFSWQDPFQSSQRLPSDSALQERTQSQESAGARHMGPPAPHETNSRTGSHTSIGSLGIPPHGGRHYRYSSHESIVHLPPSPGRYAHMSQEDRHFQYTNSQGRFESWGSAAPPMPGAIHPQGSWSQYYSSREHSLGQFPLPHASVSHPATYAAFDSRAGSGHWGPPSPHAQISPVGPTQYHYSNGSVPPNPLPHAPPPRQPPQQPCLPSSSGLGSPPSPPYEVDPSVASTWSGQGVGELVKTLSGEEYDRIRRDAASTSPVLSSKKDEPYRVPKPHMVKRMTSNHNETIETKPDLIGPSVKRCALNRDNSRASNRLKELSFPDQFKNGKFDTAKEMSELSQDMDRSSLTSVTHGCETPFDLDTPRIIDEGGGGLPPKPSRVTEINRMSTIDEISMDLMIRPVTLSASSRSTTIEALSLEFDDGPPWKPSRLERTSTMESVFSDLRENLLKPPTLGLTDRLTTKDLDEMINEPIQDDE